MENGSTKYLFSIVMPLTHTWTSTVNRLRQ
jgi:hypothetical protein